LIDDQRAVPGNGTLLGRGIDQGLVHRGGRAGLEQQTGAQGRGPRPALQLVHHWSPPLLLSLGCPKKFSASCAISVARSHIVRNLPCGTTFDTTSGIAASIVGRCRP